MLGIPRPRMMRRVGFKPGFRRFGPMGRAGGEEIILTVDEFESIRLKDLEEIDQNEAAKKMNVSQSTFNRILKLARKKIADFLVNGKPIRIEGGSYKMIGSGMGRGGGFGAGPSGDCVCPKCGHRMPHQRGVPCYKQKCPKCGATMTRG